MAESWAADPQRPLVAGLVGTHPAPACRLDSLEPSLSGAAAPAPAQSSHLFLAALQDPFLS